MICEDKDEEMSWIVWEKGGEWSFVSSVSLVQWSLVWIERITPTPTQQLTRMADNEYFDRCTGAYLMLIYYNTLLWRYAFIHPTPAPVYSFESR